MINPQLAIALSGIKQWQLVYYLGSLVTSSIRADSPEVYYFTQHGGNPRATVSNLTKFEMNEETGELIEKSIDMVTVDLIQILYPSGNTDGKLPRHIEELDIAALEKKAAELLALSELERDTIMSEILARMPKAGTPIKDLKADQRNALSDMTALIASKYGGELSDSYQSNFWGFTPSKVWSDWSYVQSDGTVAAPPNISDIPPTPPFKIITNAEGFLTVT